jgi:hypothetical protein
MRPIAVQWNKDRARGIVRVCRQFSSGSERKMFGSWCAIQFWNSGSDEANSIAFDWRGFSQ